MSSKARKIAKHLARKNGARPGRVVTKSGKGKLYRVQQIRHQQSPKIEDICL